MVKAKERAPKISNGEKISKQVVSAVSRFPKIQSLQKKIELPMLTLSFVWLFILISEIVADTVPWLFDLGTVLWIVFIFYFVLRLATSSVKSVFLKKHWLFILAILISVFRFFPFVQSMPVMRVLTATFGMQVIWIFASAEQGLRSVRRALGRRGIGYAIALTSIIIFVGAAGIFHFERLSTDPDKIQSYFKALWWTSMQMTNIGSSYAIKTQGGQIICLAISVYAAAMFGYLTAVVASFFIDRDIKDPKIEIAREKKLDDIQAEVLRLSQLLEDFVKKSSEASNVRN